jgi:integrase
MSATQPIRKKNHAYKLAMYFLQKNQIRNHTLVVLGLHTALRISDLLSLRWTDVYDFKNNRIRDTISLTEVKTKKPKVIALNDAAVSALAILLKESGAGGDYVFENPNTGRAISRIQAYRVIRAAAEDLAFEYSVSCHSLRKTFGYHAWKSGVSPAVIMEIYNHSSLAVTRRYLGVTQDEKNAVYTALRLMECKAL